MKLTKITTKGCEYLYRDPRNEQIYFKKFRKDRGNIQRSTGTTNIGQAKIKRDEFLQEFFGEQPIIKRGRELIGELFPKWIERKKLNTRPATITSITSSWKHFKPYLEFRLPEDVTSVWWETIYVPQKRSEVRVIARLDGTEKHLPLTNRKFENDRKWLIGFLNQMHKDGVLKTAVPHFVDVDKKRDPGKPLSDDQIRALLKYADKDLLLQITMGVTQGMRIGEIMGLEWDRIDLNKRTIHLREQDTKIKRARTFAISDEVYALLIDREMKTGPLFPNPRNKSVPQGGQGNKRAWKRAKRLSGVTAKFHWLRHTFLTRAFKEPINPLLICEYAGLSIEEAQDTYLHFTPDDTSAVSKLVRIS